MQLTSNTQPFIEAVVQSEFILRVLHDGLLGSQFYRDVADFGNGSSLEIKTIGSVTLQDVSEDTEVIYSPIETGKINFSISEQIGDAWFITDDLREDGHQVDALMAARSAESARAYQEIFETQFLAVLPKAHTTAGPYNINGFAHKVVSAETNGVFALSHLIKAALAFDKANVPTAGRVFIVDPVVAATLNGLVSVSSDVTPFAADILSKGISSEMQFRMNFYGWDIMVSRRLHTATGNDGTTSITNGVWNLGMCVLDDQCKPIMGAWRRRPSVEGERNKDKRRNEFTSSARWGFGVQRMDTAFVLVTHPTNIS